MTAKGLFREKVTVLRRTITGSGETVETVGADLPASITAESRTTYTPNGPVTYTVRTVRINPATTEGFTVESDDVIQVDGLTLTVRDAIQVRTQTNRVDHWRATAW